MLFSSPIFLFSFFADNTFRVLHIFIKNETS